VASRSAMKSVSRGGRPAPWRCVWRAFVGGGVVGVVWCVVPEQPVFAAPVLPHAKRAPLSTALA
jgi:hypothetical protein